MKEQIWNYLLEKHEKSGGNNGCYVAEMLYNLNYSYKEARNVLNSFFKEGKIEIRDGSKGQLIFIKKNEK